jgi:hypothetical protein
MIMTEQADKITQNRLDAATLRREIESITNPAARADAEISQANREKEFAKQAQKDRKAFEAARASRAATPPVKSENSDAKFLAIHNLTFGG